MLKFFYNGLKDGGKLQKASYSTGPYTPESGLPDETITITARDYMRFSAEYSRGLRRREPDRYHDGFLRQGSYPGPALASALFRSQESLQLPASQEGSQESAVAPEIHPGAGAYQKEDQSCQTKST
jgi:hypothetical protein